MKLLIALTLLILVFNNCGSPEKPTDSVTQISLFELFTIAPTSLFDYTSEGISEEEKINLINNGESESWNITYKGDDKIIIICKFLYSELTLFPLTRPDNTTILGSYTINEQASSIHTWEQINDTTLQQINLLPTVYAKDFFMKEDQIPQLEKYDGNVYYYLDSEAMLIKAGLNTWMEPELEKMKMDYSIYLKWNGAKFEINRLSI